jgi:hypothetical protein
MKKLYFTGMLALCCSGLFAQAQFASYLIDFSSEYHVEIDTICNTTWSACQILGSPDVYPIYADNGSAWASQTPDGSREFITVGFDVPVAIDTVYVYQTLNTGAIDSIYLRNAANGEWQKVWWTTAAPETQTSKILAAGFPMATYLVNGVRLALNSPVVPGHNEIDAISIGGVVLSNKGPENKTSVSLYPNPSQHNFTVDAGNALVETLRVTDILGRVVFESFDLNKNVVNVNTQLKTGTYFVEVSGVNFKETLRFVKE